MFRIFRILRNDDQGSQGGGGGASGGGSQGGQGNGQGGQAGAGAGGGQQGGQGSQPPAFTIPDTYKGKGWAGKVKSQEDLFKLVDNLDTAVGKKTVVPDLENGSPEEVKAYLETLRGTTQKGDYKFGDKTPKAIAEKYATLLFDNGIPKSIANKIIAGHETLMSELAAMSFSKDGIRDELKKSFGDDFEKRSGRVVNAVKENMSPKDQKFFDESIPNNQVGFIYRFMDAVLTKYGAKEGGHGGEGGNNGGSGSGKPIEQVRSEIRNEMAQLVKGPYTKEQKAALQKRLDDTYKNQQ